MGADLVIAVDLNSDILGRHLVRAAQAAPRNSSNEWLRRLQDNLGSLWPNTTQPENTQPPEGDIPSMLNVVASSLNIMQVRITRSRMAGEPPDIIISPRLAHLGLLDFHQAKTAIEAGHSATQASIHALTALGIVKKDTDGSA